MFSGPCCPANYQMFVDINVAHTSLWVALRFCQQMCIFCRVLEVVYLAVIIIRLSSIWRQATCKRDTATYILLVWPWLWLSDLNIGTWQKRRGHGGGMCSVRLCNGAVVWQWVDGWMDRNINSCNTDKIVLDKYLHSLPRRLTLIIYLLWDRQHRHLI